MIYFLHGGGLILNNQYTDVAVPLALAREIGAVVISVDYRLAPEHTAPAATEDYYSGLV